MAHYLVLHGPNLNRLGQRDKQHYGSTTLAQINQQLSQLASSYQDSITAVQSNAEHVLIDTIQQTHADAIIVNAAAYSHTSIALRDALIDSGTPIFEVHMSNVAARETFRQHSLISDIAIGTIQGFGALSYTLALQAAHHHCLRPSSPQMNDITKESINGYS